MISVSDLIFEYPTKRALHGVSFTVEKGSVVALVGPNGAGKTTLLRCMAALDEPYAGGIVIDGISATDDPRGVHARLGFLPDFFGLYDELTVEQSLIYAARMHAMPQDAVAAATARAAGRVGIADRFGQKASELSRGLKQRLAIAMTIVHGPRVLLLDEPAAGLDPDARRALSELILSLRDEGMTIVVSSHILAELEDYCTRMIIVENGRIAGGGVVEVAQREHQRVRVRLALPKEGFSEVLAGRDASSVVSVTGNDYLIDIPPGAAARAELLSALVKRDFAVSDFAEAPRTLEEAYRAEVSAQKASDTIKATGNAA